MPQYHRLLVCDEARMYTSFQLVRHEALSTAQDDLRARNWHTYIVDWTVLRLCRHQATLQIFDKPRVGKVGLGILHPCFPLADCEVGSGM